MSYYQTVAFAGLAAVLVFGTMAFCSRSLWRSDTPSDPPPKWLTRCMLLTTLVVMLPAAYGGYVLDREYYEHTAEREEYRRLERMNYVAYDIRLIANGGRQPTVQQRIAGWAWSILGALAIAAFAAWCTAALWNALGYLVHLIPDFPRGPAQSIEDRSPEGNL